MSFAHSAYSTMGMSHAREVLKTKMMPKHFTDRQQAAAGPSRGGSAGKRAKTSAHTSNVNLQAVCHGPLCMLPANSLIVPTGRWRAFWSHTEAVSSGPSCLPALPSVPRSARKSPRCPPDVFSHVGRFATFFSDNTLHALTGIRRPRF